MSQVNSETCFNNSTCFNTNDDSKYDEKIEIECCECHEINSCTCSNIQTFVCADCHQELCMCQFHFVYN